MATLQIPNYHFFDYLYFRIMEHSPLQITPLDGCYHSLAPPIKQLAAHQLAVGDNAAPQPDGTINGTIDQQTKWETADARACGMIVLFTKPHIQMTLQSFKYLKEVWDDLVTKYGTPGSTSLLTEFLH